MLIITIYQVQNCSYNITNSHSFLDTLLDDYLNLQDDFENCSFSHTCKIDNSVAHGLLISHEKENKYRMKNKINSHIK